VENNIREIFMTNILHSIGYAIIVFLVSAYLMFFLPVEEGSEGGVFVVAFLIALAIFLITL